MTFEQIIALSSVAVSALAVVVPYIGLSIQLKHQTKKEKYSIVCEEKDLCAEFLGYCKKAQTFGLSDEDMRHFTELYAKLHLIGNAELRNALTSYCDAIITNQSTSDSFVECMMLFEKHFKAPKL